MRFDVTRGHAFCIHRQDLFLDVLTDAGLVLLQELRLKFSLAVSGNGHFHISKTGAQRLTAVTIPTVIRLFVLVVVLAVTKLIIQFRIQAILHEFRYCLLEEILDILHAVNVARLQEFPDLCPPGLLFWTAILSAAHCKTSNVVLLFYTTSEVYTNLGMVSISLPGSVPDVYREAML